MDLSGETRKGLAMGTELIDRRSDTMQLSLRRAVGLARMVAGSVDHPTGRRHYLTRHATREEREEAERLSSALTSATDPTATYAGKSADDARIGIVSTMLMGFAVGQLSEAGIEAKFDVYGMAIDDIPAWAIAEAVRLWARRECPVSVEAKPRYDFPPGPGTLRGLSLWVLEPYKSALERVRTFLNATTYQEAAKSLSGPRPASEGQSLIPRLKRM